MWREDNENTATLPPAFRTSRDRFKTDPNLPTRKGLDTLNISGSSQPSAEQLAQIANTLRTKTDGPIYVVDLRQETHPFCKRNSCESLWQTQLGQCGQILSNYHQ